MCHECGLLLLKWREALRFIGYHLYSVRERHCLWWSAAPGPHVWVDGHLGITPQILFPSLFPSALLLTESLQPPSWLPSCWTISHRPAHLVVVQPHNWRKGPKDSNRNIYWTRNPAYLKQRIPVWHSTMDRRQQAGHNNRLRHLEEEATICRDNWCQVGHQLPGKPAARAADKHIGSYWLSSKIKRLGTHGCEVGAGWAEGVREQENSHLEWTDNT